MDTSLLAYCTTPDGDIVAYVRSDGLPAWSREAQAQASQGAAATLGSPAGGSGSQGQGVDAGAPAEAAEIAVPSGADGGALAPRLRILRTHAQNITW